MKDKDIEYSMGRMFDALGIAHERLNGLRDDGEVLAELRRVHDELFAPGGPLRENYGAGMSIEQCGDEWFEEACFLTMEIRKAPSLLDGAKALVLTLALRSRTLIIRSWDEGFNSSMRLLGRFTQEELASLEPHQVRYLDLRSQGLRYKAIADQMQVAEPTVRYHFQQIASRLGLSGEKAVNERLKGVGRHKSDGK